MVDGATTYYGWVLPEEHASPTTWGHKLNADLQAIDGQVHANQTAIANGGTMVGQITMFAGATPPTNWLWCDGSAVSTTTYATLYALLGGSFNIGGETAGTFRVPNLTGRVPVGYGGTWALGATGGEQNHTLLAAEMPTHAHGVNDPGHAHGISDPGHNHSQSPHGHGINDPGHAHTIPAVPGAGAWYFASSGIQALTSGATGSSGAGVTVAANTANINAAATGIGVAAAVSGISLANAGSGAAHNVMQPYAVVGFIIRAL